MDLITEEDIQALMALSKIVGLKPGAKTALLQKLKQSKVCVLVNVQAWHI
jgi:hypothetical protein